MFERTRRHDRDDEEEDSGKTAETARECPECQSGTLRESPDRRDIVCETCGLVVTETTIDRGPEWRAFTHRERQQKSRTGAPLTERMHDRGLTTSIDWHDRDASGRMLSGKKRRQLSRLRKWQERIRTKDASERNLQFALSEIDRMASAVGVPGPTREVASVLYRRALDADLIRGRSIEGVASSALYAACRETGLPRSLDEITRVARVEQREIGRTYRYLADELGLDIEPTDPKQFLPRFASELDVEEDVPGKAREIVEISTEQGALSGKSPTGFAAAALYAACLLAGDRRTQSEVADIAQVTQVTVRNRFEEQLDAIVSRECNEE